MTGEEKRRLLKEQYKRDLKQRKAFLEDAKRLRHSARLNKAVGELMDGVTKDDSDEWIQKLNEESALSEAKMEMFMDDLTTEDKIDKLAKEAEAEKFSAEQMVLQMKREMGLIPKEEKKPVEKKEEAPADEKKAEKKEKDNDLPAGRKPLGDF